ncbi:hypothetical protein QQF64_008032 [Cirrhinus molitorella]|uniref:Uncharacterized protein n=1 Tax=Cirrhinus molitorella TaxID=172907 RepID=A0ABR3M5V4_9TELE
MVTSDHCSSKNMLCSRSHVEAGNLRQWHLDQRVHTLPQLMHLLQILQRTLLILHTGAERHQVAVFFLHVLHLLNERLVRARQQCACPVQSLPELLLLLGQNESRGPGNTVTPPHGPSEPKPGFESSPLAGVQPDRTPPPSAGLSTCP